MRQNLLIGAMGWPNKLGDYLSYGRPVMISPYGDLISFVKEHKEGFIVINKDDTINIKENLAQILLQKEKLIKMGQINREIAEKEISWNARVQQLIKQIQ